MTDKEKAKAYEDALDRAKKFDEKYGGGYAAYIFPELQESEDDDLMMKAVIGILGEEDHPRLCAWVKALKEAKEKRP